MAMNRQVTKRYEVKYIRRPRVSRAWGRKTKTHRCYLVFETMAEAMAVRRAVRRFQHRLDTTWVKPTTEDASGVSVEDAGRGLYNWKVWQGK